MVMTDKYLRYLFITIGYTLLFSYVGAVPVMALPTPNFCFTVADDGNRLHTMNTDGSDQLAATNATGVLNIEAIAFNPQNLILYAADADTLGTINYDSTSANYGVYTPIGTFGTVNGADGAVTIADVDGLSFDPFTNTLYGVNRLPSQRDQLIIIDVATGAADPDAFGPGVGYVSVTDNNAATNWDDDIDDLAIDPTDGSLYAIANSGGTEDHLVIIDRDTGLLTDIGILTYAATGANAEDMEGLSFFNDGTLYGTTGNNASTADQDTLWRINISSPPLLETIDQFASDGDYEAVDCLVGDTNQKSGFVYADANQNGTFDVGENPLPGVTVEIYRDTGSIIGSIDSGDILAATAITDVNGQYMFELAAIGSFILQVDITTLPPNIEVTDNIEFVNFDNCNSAETPYDDFGCSETNNNFPTITPVDLRIAKTDNADPVNVGDSVSYTITVTNDGPSTANNVTVTDTFSGASFTVTGVTSSQGSCTAFPCNLGTLAADASATITITGTADIEGTIINNATVDSDQQETNAANNTAEEITLVGDPTVDLRIAKTDNADPVNVGDSVSYTITVTNDGPSTANNVTVTDTFSGASFTVTGVTSSQGSCTAFPCNLGTLAADASATITITGTADVEGTIINNTTVDSDQQETNPANNAAQQTTTVGDVSVGVSPPPSVSADPSIATGDSSAVTGDSVITADGLVLSISGTSVASVGETITFVITVTNPTSQTITNVVLMDNVSTSYYDVISATLTRGTVTTNGNLVTVNIGSLAPNETITLTIETLTTRIGFPPDTCNSATFGETVSNPFCPLILPSDLPETGQSPWSNVRLIIIALVTGLTGVGVLRKLVK